MLEMFRLQSQNNMLKEAKKSSLKLNKCDNYKKLFKHMYYTMCLFFSFLIYMSK